MNSSNWLNVPFNTVNLLLHPKPKVLFQFFNLGLESSILLCLFELEILELQGVVLSFKLEEHKILLLVQDSFLQSFNRNFISGSYVLNFLYDRFNLGIKVGCFDHKWFHHNASLHISFHLNFDLNVILNVILNVSLHISFHLNLSLHIILEKVKINFRSAVQTFALGNKGTLSCSLSPSFVSLCRSLGGTKGINISSFSVSFDSIFSSFGSFSCNIIVGNLRIVGIVSLLLANFSIARSLKSLSLPRQLLLVGFSDAVCSSFLFHSFGLLWSL